MQHRQLLAAVAALATPPQTAPSGSPASREIVEDRSVTGDPHNLATRLMVVADGAEDKSDD